jgi:hypothetical protein
MEQLLKYAVSSNDIINITKNNNIVKYKEIKNYETIDDLLGIKNGCFILFETQEGFGHWCVLTKHNDLIELFDPYGIFIEKQKLYIDDENFKDPINWLSILLKKCNYRVSYNEYEFQNINYGQIGTCGKWCILRYLNKHIELNKFKNMIEKDMKKLNITEPDILAVLIFFYSYNI